MDTNLKEHKFQVKDPRECCVSWFVLAEVEDVPGRALGGSGHTASASEGLGRVVSAWLHCGGGAGSPRAPEVELQAVISRRHASWDKSFLGFGDHFVKELTPDFRKRWPCSSNLALEYRKKQGKV